MHRFYFSNNFINPSTLQQGETVFGKGIRFFQWVLLAGLCSNAPSH